ncbi:SRPBCC family protein [Tenggerimyces flavus]|uniref:SRPBCC family protein n=1 Tax=Tenggerimyces flavus TaxID=1708749 RepID=A0ABV7YFY9_9ACTN|nr:SRPBCC family protein [Tenggerimyces flavus]MBM7788160.1 uncharacterized protein YndB with AHSA1/START domain [Tenggerimyces flavus]
MNEYVRTDGDNEVLVLERSFDHPPAKVWRALTEPEQLAQWFPASMTVELAVGAKITFSFGPEDDPQDGEVTACDPPRTFAYSWGSEHLRWELEPDGDGCKLTLTQTFQDRPAAASYAAGWHGCFVYLALVVDGQQPFGADGDASLDHTMTPDLKSSHEEWIVKLGLDAGTVDGEEARYERQLVQGPLDVWEVLSGGTVVSVGGAVPAGFLPAGVQVGPILVAEPPDVLATAEVRWTMREGNGGARLVVTHAGGDDKALAQWRAHLEALAARLV